MDKRTKILLGVLGVIVLLAVGYFGFMMMTAEDMGEMTATPTTGVKVAKAPAPAANQAEAGKAPATPAPAAPATGTAEAAKTTAPAAPGKEAAKPATAGTGAPATPPSAGKEAAKAAPPATTAAQPASKEAAKPAPAPVQCVTAFKVTVKGKEVQFDTPEDVVAKSGLGEDQLKSYSAKSLADAKKEMDALKKSKGSPDAVDCASKKLALAEKLSSLVAAKYPKTEEQKVYTYSSLNKRDPFMSPLEIPKVYPKIPVTAPPIQQVPAEQLKVIAIIWNDRGFRALISTPDNRAYTVKVGDTIGNKKGKVEKITEKRVYIKELIPDIFGDIETRVTVLKLYKETEQP